METDLLARLVCVECGVEPPPDVKGWRTLLTVGDEDAEDEEEVATYCPCCPAAEFGPGTTR